jgi:hypothetical protein
MDGWGDEGEPWVLKGPKPLSEVVLRLVVMLVVAMTFVSMMKKREMERERVERRGERQRGGEGEIGGDYCISSPLSIAWTSPS